MSLNDFLKAKKQNLDKKKNTKESDKGTNEYVKSIVRIVAIAGAVEIACIIVNIGFSQILKTNYEKMTDVLCEASMNVETFMNDMYRYQNVMYGYVNSVSSVEDYESEMVQCKDMADKLLPKLKDASEVLKDNDITTALNVVVEDYDTYGECVDETVSLLQTPEDAKMKVNNDLLRLLSQMNNDTTTLITYIDVNRYELSDRINSLNKNSRILSITIILIAAGSIVLCMSKSRRIGSEIVGLKDEAESANELKSAFLANMSHEIRTPINAVLSMDEMILRECKDQKLIEYATDIKSAGKTLLSLINDILDISKIESGKLELVNTPYNLLQLINEEMVLMSPKAKEKGLELKISMAQMLPSGLEGDAIRIKQIITNLVNNAIKYTKEGSVKVSVSGLKLISNEDGDCTLPLVITVSDTGIGIKDEDMGKLFEKFQRIEEKRNKNIEGTGLGMSITKQLVDMMDGIIEVSSEYGKGSSFKVTIPQHVLDMTPVSRVHLTTEPEFSEETYLYAPDAKILVTDDNEMNRKAMKLLLGRTLIQVDTASSGKECIRMVKAETYDVIFLDHMMPEMDGIETLKAIRKIPKELNPNDKTPIIMLTANAIAGAREAYLDEGFTDFLSKPVDPRTLEVMLRKYIPEDLIQQNPSRHSEVEKIPMETSSVSVDRSTPPDNTNESAENEKQMKNVDEFDYEMAMKNCGNRDVFETMAHDFISLSNAKGKKLQALYRICDWKNYKIEVHALKSSARIVGLRELGDLAQELEKAADIENIRVIDESHDVLMKMYMNAKNVLPINYEENPVAEDDLSYDDKIALLGSIKNAVKDGDVDNADDILEILNECYWEEAGKDLLGELSDAVLSIDVDTVEQISQELMQLVVTMYKKEAV